MAPKKAFGKSKKTTKKIMANSPKQVMDLKVAKGFTEAQSDEHKRNWDDKNGAGHRDMVLTTAHETA